MHKFLSRFFLVLALLVSGASLAVNQAPVEDITQEPGAAQVPRQDANNSPQMVTPTQTQPMQVAPPSASMQQTAPAINTAPPESTVDTQSMPEPQRISRLEQQVNNLTRMNLPAQMSQLQDQLQKLRGQVETEHYQIQRLQQQQKTFYQDLIAQIKQLRGGAAVVNKAPAPTAKPQSAQMTSGATNALQDSKAYKKAFGLMMQKKFTAAKTGFISYLTQFPKGRFAMNAHYWLGEIHLLQYQYDDAATQFEKVIKQYPHSKKVPDAKLKLAMIHINKGNKTAAKKELQQIKRQYPGTTAAQLASIQLQRLESNS